MVHKIFHMASFSRSGETLLLRCLNAHPDIHVVHQVVEPDREEDLQLFRFLTTYEPTEIPHSHELIQKAGVKPGAVLVLKNAVWTHKYKFKGFVLVRNPFSVVNSFKIIKETPEKFEARKAQYKRWARGIDERLMPLMNDPDNIACLCALYNVKMFPLAGKKLPIIRYEEFVLDPERELRRILSHLGVEWNDIVLNSHALYKEGQYGHGRIPLWMPIHAGSLHSYKDMPGGILSKIYGLTKPTMERFGYRFSGGECVLPARLREAS